MKFAFKFSNLLGTVYQKGNVVFTRDDTLVSLVGNRISLFDLKNNKTETLNVESRYNFTTVALAPSGCYLIAANEFGEAVICSLVSKTVLHVHHFKRPIRAISFSPDGKYFALTKDNNVFVYRAPGMTVREFNPFSLVRQIQASFDDTLCLDWSSDSQVLAVGGKDMCTKICGVGRFENIKVFTLGGHSDAVVGCFFEEDSLDIYTVSKNGQLCIWESNLDSSDLIPRPDKPPEDIENAENLSPEASEDQKMSKLESKDVNEPEKIHYRRLAKHYLKDAVKADGYVSLKAAAFHKRTRILVTGYSVGVFLVHEMPDVNLIHSLQLGNAPITAAAFNNSGDWIAVGSASAGQLIVWEWQSESYIFKQQGHLNNMNCLAYSPDGQYIATGSDDGKVKIWNTSSGVCFVTFVDHKSGVTGVCFMQSGKAVVSSSLDGTVRAFDMHRYRNFRTFTAPRPTQFSCLTVDPSGDIVCAGSQDTFEIFVWSMQTGRLTDILAGHEAPVGGLSFSPCEAVLVSASWDKTVRIWDVFEHKGSRETITFLSDALTVQFRPDGQEFAVATLDGNINFFNVHTAVQLGSIEGRNDLGSGRRDTDQVTAKKLLSTQAFTTLCYTADGECILAGGRSKNVCIYHVPEKILIKKFTITCNLSLDGVTDFINRRKMTEFGNKALIEERDEIEMSASIALPGVKKTDMASRAFKPEVRVSCVRFSPGGRSWAATTTEGLLVYSLDNNLMFDPFHLTENITPVSVKKALAEGEYSSAVMMSLHLNEVHLTVEVVETVPLEQVEIICRSLHETYAERLLAFLGSQLEKTRHFEFYVTWIQQLLLIHGPGLKQQSQKMLPILNTVQKSVTQKFGAVEKMVDYNVHMLKYVLNLGKLRAKRKIMRGEDEQDDDSLIVKGDSDVSDMNDDD